ncbi:MAG: S9 family peptidase [Verrucomicrobia bacterium]|nr:S9 family peptidase [Verrucomicrobiota bacterium]MDA1069731.1 S9 family peptidase [Verrucomicrobiota bacterium]
MKYLSLLLVSLFSSLVFQACGSKSETVQNTPQYSIEQFFENKRITGGRFSPDETKLLVSSNETGIFNLFEIDIATGEMTQLTFSDTESLFAIDYIPGTDQIIYSADHGGDENNHIFLLEANGDSRDLTPKKDEKVSFMGWVKDRKSFYFSSNRRDPKFYDLYRMKTSDWSSEMIYENTSGLSLGDVSKDGSKLTVARPITTSENKLFMLDVAYGEQTEISDPEKPGSYNSSGFSQDGKSLFYYTNADGEFAYLARFDISSGEHEKVFETNWDVSYSYLSENEKYRVTGINEDGRNVLKIQEATTGLEVGMPDISDGNVLGVSISRSEERMRLSVGTSRSPSDNYVYEFASRKLKRLTNSLNPAIDADHLVSAEVVRFLSFDGLEIPAIYYKPKTATAESPAPAMVWVHGGPGGQTRVDFSELIQYLVNHGYAVLAVNNRGSSGYGKTFYKMDDLNHGEKDLMDCVYGKNYLQTLDYIDPDKIGILGGSYGGFMTMAAMTLQPDEFKVGVNIFGVTNWVRTLNSIPPHWASFKDALYAEMGDPNDPVQAERLQRISPVFHGNKVKSPVMVLQGANDIRVLQVESDDMVEAVRANGVPVEYVIFPDEGHGFLKKENQIKGYGQILEFLNKYLKGGS